MQVPVRRGLPRTPGGEPWPPVATVEVAGLREPELPASTIAPIEQAALTDVPVRRGLPRIPGGEPWPPVETVRIALPLRELAEDEAPADVASAADAVSATGANGVAVPLWSPQYQTYVVATIGLLSAMYDEARLHREVAPQMVDLAAALGSLLEGADGDIFSNRIERKALPVTTHNNNKIIKTEAMNELEAGTRRPRPARSVRAGDGRR